MSDRPLGGWAGAGEAIISTPEEVARFLSAVLRGADVTAQPGITASAEGVARYARVVAAADTALTCRMLNRPV